ncbi:hypothetical protein GGF32_003908 [Allomyces javanicus]|nr:hypothetical protein GGF32_003908 [Allomyces javanicus]
MPNAPRTTTGPPLQSSATSAPPPLQPVQPELRAKRTKNAARNGERRPRRQWGQHEIDSLIQGVQKVQFALDMKDKWRVLTSRRAKSAPDLPVDLASLPRAVNPRWAQDSTRKKIANKSARRGSTAAPATGQDGAHDASTVSENSTTTMGTVDTASATSSGSSANDHHGDDHEPLPPPPAAPRRANKRKRAASPGPPAAVGAVIVVSPQPVAQPVIRHSPTRGYDNHNQPGPIIHVDAVLCWSDKPHTPVQPPRRVVTDFTRPPSPLPAVTSHFPFMPLSLLAPQHLIRGQPVAIPSPFDPGTFWFGTARPPQPPDPPIHFDDSRLQCFPFGRATTSSSTSVSPSAIDFPCFPTSCAPEWTHPSLVIPRPFPSAATDVPLPAPAPALVARLLDVMARTRSITSYYWHTRYARDIEVRGVLAKIERRMNRATVAFASVGDYGAESAAWVARCTRESNDDRDDTDDFPVTSTTTSAPPPVPKEFVYHQDFFNARYSPHEGAQFRATALARYVYRGRGATHLPEAPREAEIAVREAQMRNHHAWLYGNRNTQGIPVMDVHELAHAAAQLDPATREAALALLAHRAFGQVLWFAWLHEELHTLFARYPPLPARSAALDDFGGRTHRVMPHGGRVSYSHDAWLDEVWGQLRRGKRFLDEIEGRRRRREGCVEGEGAVQIERAPKRVERLFSQYRFHWVGEDQVMPFR